MLYIIKKELMTENNKKINLDAQSVNFREIRMGNISPGTLYRSSHPIKDNKQDSVIAMLASNARISTVINLHDTNSGLYSKSFIAPWYNKLYKSNRVIALGMNFSVTSESFKKKLKKLFQFMIKTEGPYLIHCHAGVDRTGFVCMVLEAFMGAKLDDVVNDYLKSFNSIFESNIYEAEKADKLTAMKILSAISDSEIITDENLQQIAESYMRNSIKLTNKEIIAIKMRLSCTKADTGKIKKNNPPIIS